MNCIRPDVAYRVSKLNDYQSNHGKNHCKAIIRVLGYLKYSKDSGLYYTKYLAIMDAFCDTNSIFDSNNPKSTCGYVFTLVRGNNLCKSSK